MKPWTAFRVYTLLLVVLVALTGVCFGHERTIINDELAKSATADADAYWAKLTGVWRDQVRETTAPIWKQWKKTKAGLKVNKKCADVIEQMIKHPIDEEWSARMIDSMSIFPAGVLSGTSTELGDFDQCLATSGTFQEQSFVGKYCLATVHLPKSKLFTPLAVNRTNLQPAWIGKVIEQWHHNDNWYALSTALCFPSICHQDDIRDILKANYPILESFHVNVTYCQSNDEPQKYHPGIWIALSLLSLSIVPVILGTLLDATTDASTVRSPVGKYLLAHSAISNTKILFRFTDSSQPQQGQSDSSSSEGGQFAYIHGIRAIASLIIIYCHTFGLMLVPLNMKVSAYARYPGDMKETNKMLAAQPIFNGALIVQLFFAMSGMLLTYSALAPKLKISFFPFVLLRWLRYTPPVIGTICLTLVLQLLGNGPLFHHDLIWPNVRSCYHSWWKNLLYINNFSDFNEQCSIQTWYLSAEMQLHIIGFLLLLAYRKSPRLAYLTSAALVALGVLIIVTIISLNLTPLSLFHIYTYTEYPTPTKPAKIVYFMPYMQFISYFLGCIVGQLLLEKRQLNLPRPLSALFSLLTTAIYLTYPFLTYPLIQQDRVLFTETDFSTSIPYISYIFFWAFANAWFLYQCSIHSRSVLSRFLSAKIFQPISRLSFSLYLVHMMTIWYNTHQTRTAISLVNLNELNKLISLTLVQSFFLAYLLYLTFEAPSVNLMKMLKPDAKPPREKTEEQSVAAEPKKEQ